jgi:hypothetical protein
MIAGSNVGAKQTLQIVVLPKGVGHVENCSRQRREQRVLSAAAVNVRYSPMGGTNGGASVATCTGCRRKDSI